MASTGSVRKAKETIRKILYITIATSSSSRPWNSPVYSAFDKNFNFYWASWKDNQHSKNIRKNANAFVVIYDSRAAEGTGFGVYMSGRAYQLEREDNEDIGIGAKLLAVRKGGKPRRIDEYLNSYPRRMYKFVPKRVWVNSDGKVNGNYVDTRTDITKGLLGRK
ncbi:MAG: pyridoxamine 5'-phosphate oxidase family protein [Candidatus Micrarchaeota archaeon]|nr:pyridoxamine 5'-phosphate oxidase family protein [Candidatus Micrarchaeota archaeon]